MKAFSSKCHPNFLSQIDEFVRKPLEEELNVVVYDFPVHGSEEFTPTKTVMIYIKVYSTDDDDFKKACEVISVSYIIKVNLDRLHVDNCVHVHVHVCVYSGTSVIRTPWD